MIQALQPHAPGGARALLRLLLVALGVAIAAPTAVLAATAVIATTVTATTAATAAGACGGEQEAGADGRPLVLEAGRSLHLRVPFAVGGVSLTDPAVADVQVLSPQLLLVSGMAPGRTDLVAWSEDGRTLEWQIEVDLPLERLRADLTVLLPRAQLRLTQGEGTLVVSGSLSAAGDTALLHEYFRRRGFPWVDGTRLHGVQQVQLLVRVAEVNRTSIRAMGFNGFRTGDDFFLGSTIGPSGGGPLQPISIGPPLGAGATGGTPFVFTSPLNISPAVSLFAGFPGADIEVFLQALAENQYLRILSEPTLVALSGEEASFLAGGEFPIPVVQGAGSVGGTSVTIEFKEFGVRLRFRPVVLGEGAIRLEVSSEVSELTDLGAISIQGFRVPSLITRRADSTLEMNSGESFAMAGLLSESTNAITSRVPGLGAIPVLGNLFRSVRYRRGETELVVLVTPRLVEPIAQASMPPLGGTDHVQPSDWELYALGRLEGRTPARVGIQEQLALEFGRFERLKGPGAWATHDQAPARSRARRTARGE
jgi:pilus assembly protein CpaC